MEQQILNLLMYSVPSLITGGIAYYFFKEHTKNEDGRRRFLLKKELQVNALPLRLQAYERMTLFLERIKPSNLLIRVNPSSSIKEDYVYLIIQNIEQEFEHNLAQQIYVSEDCWKIINASKNATIQLIRKVNLMDKIENANMLREAVLTEMITRQSPSDTALLFIKEEVSELWQNS